MTTRETVKRVQDATREQGLRYGISRRRDGSLLITDNQATGEGSHVTVHPDCAKDFLVAVASALTMKAALDAPADGPVVIRQDPVKDDIIIVVAKDE